MSDAALVFVEVLVSYPWDARLSLHRWGADYIIFISIEKNHFLSCMNFCGRNFFQMQKAKHCVFRAKFMEGGNFNRGFASALAAWARPCTRNRFSMRSYAITSVKLMRTGSFTLFLEMHLWPCRLFLVIYYFHSLFMNLPWYEYRWEDEWRESLRLS